MTLNGKKLAVNKVGKNVAPNNLLKFFTPTVVQTIFFSNLILFVLLTKQKNPAVLIFVYFRNLEKPIGIQIAGSEAHYINYYNVSIFWSNYRAWNSNCVCKKKE